MASSSSSSTVNYDDILAAAFRNLGQVNADADMQQEKARQAYNNQLTQSAQNRTKGMTASHENASTRGLLDSSIALNQDTDVNQSIDQQNSVYLNNYTGTLDQLAKNRLAAQNNYDDANIQKQRDLTVTGLDAATTPGINAATGGVYDPADPYGWKDIAAEKAANPDPYNWQGIAASMIKPAVVPKAKTLSPFKPAPIVKPVQPTKVLRY